MLDILLDAGLDSVKMLPFLYLAYLLIEWIERTRGSRIEALLAEGSRWGAAVGALLGTIPQCGFSAMAASLYGSGVITLGTLMAVFIATSDEAIPMLLAVPERWPELAMLILIKLCIALAVGLLLDLVVTRLLPAPLRGGFTGKAAAVDCHCLLYTSSQLIKSSSRRFSSGWSSTGIPSRSAWASAGGSRPR